MSDLITRHRQFRERMLRDLTARQVVLDRQLAAIYMRQVRSEHTEVGRAI